MRIAHLSDLHFSHLTFSPLQLFSKRWLGNLNHLLFRRGEFCSKVLKPFVALLQELKVDLVLISGDLTTTAHKSEFKRALEFVHSLQEVGIKIFLVPGNHDHYTQKAYKKKLFYQFFPNLLLQHEGVSVHKLMPGWVLVALDTALATSLTSSQGYFSPEIEKRLEKALEQNSQDSVLMVNHFPFFKPDGEHRKLVRQEALQKLLMKSPHVKLYLHGHTHRHALADLRTSNLPLILDSGSITHTKHGSWNLLDLEETSCTVSAYAWKDSGWEVFKKGSFSL